MTPMLPLLTLALIVITLGYGVMCLVSPFGRCWWCGGAGRTRSYGCLYCHDTGLRARLGWRLVRLLTEVGRDATSTNPPFTKNRKDTD